MEQVLAVVGWFGEHKAVILGFLFSLSEALAFIPFVKSNSVFELVFGWLKKEAPKL